MVKFHLSHHFWCSNPMKIPISLVAPGNPGLAIGLTKSLELDSDPGPDLLKILVFSPKSTHPEILKKSRESCFLDGFWMGFWLFDLLKMGYFTIKNHGKNHGFAASMVLFFQWKIPRFSWGSYRREPIGNRGIIVLWFLTGWCPPVISWFINPIN